MAVITMAFVVAPQFFIGFFVHAEQQSSEVAISCLRIMGMGMVFYGLEMTINQAFNGAGDTYTPTVLNFVGFWMVQIPLAFFLAQKLHWQENGVFYAIVLAELVLALLCVIVFKLGYWKNRRV